MSNADDPKNRGATPPPRDSGYDRGFDVAPDFPVPQPCYVVDGILFGRKPCQAKTQFACHHCRKPVCQQHSGHDREGVMYCNSCLADDDSWDDDYRYERSGSSMRTTDRHLPAAAGTGAAATTLGDEDRDGLVGRDEPAGEGVDKSTDPDSGFDAS